MTTTHPLRAALYARVSTTGHGQDVGLQLAFRDGAVKSSGTAITKVLPPVSRFSAGGGHEEKKERVLERLNAFFERFYGLASETPPESA